MNIRVYIRHTVIALLFTSFAISPNLFISELRAEQINESEILVIEKAEYFFTSLRDNKFDKVWSSLSAKSQEKVIDEITKSSEKMGGSLKKEDIQQDFEKRGIIFINYWNAFASRFNADMILNDSRWEIGYVKGNKAQIIITYKESKTPANLMMYKENSSWKVGLAETFWTRKY